MSTVLQYLQASELFAKLNPQDLEQVAEISKLLQFPSGYQLFASQEEKNSDLYILLEGKLEVLSKVVGVASQKKMQYAQIEKEMFGEISWLLKMEPSAILKCTGPTKVLRINGVMLHAYMDNHSNFGYNLMKRMAKMIAKRFAATSNVLTFVLRNSE